MHKPNPVEAGGGFESFIELVDHQEVILGQ